ncbi:[FeFe] hydrogenase H-cluster maturation GTPase HydF [Clostridia bacterium]|nr:[FeFe] hydrogenase H-cluster maturation GTPase HydF [Clostridia bacterium]
MSMNDTPSAVRVKIGFFGKRNAGKSRLVNAVTGQDLAVVSTVAGTTTDPVKKAMELLPLGPVLIIDTPGIDDIGELGELRIKKTKQILRQIDVAVLVVDAQSGKSDIDDDLIESFEKVELPYIVAYNKSDLLYAGSKSPAENEIYVSAKTGENIRELKDFIAKVAVPQNDEKRLVGDLLAPMDFVVLVTPIDSAAPKGRLILPQQQVVRDILEAQAVSIVIREFELRDTLIKLGQKPRLVITDSQAFKLVSEEVPADVPLTSFSILFARYKGMLEQAIVGAKVIDELKAGDTILISEGCTHHRQCDDIGTVKLPKLLKSYAKTDDLNFEFSAGNDFPEELSKYKLVIHCGGCMQGDKEMTYRQNHAKESGVPLTNYGIALAFIQGILERSVAPLGY